MSYLADTHVLLQRHAGEGNLSQAHAEVLHDLRSREPLLVTDISLWEIATLCSLGRVAIDGPLGAWLEHATAPPLVRRLDISPAVAAEVAALPSSFHGDPADRIIVATARVLGATLLTSDQRIVSSGLCATV